MTFSERLLFPSVLLAVTCAVTLVSRAHADEVRDVLCTQAYAQSMQTKSMFAKIDADHDGKVTHEEVVAYFGTLFDTLDTNHNGVLDDKEWFGARSNAPVVDLTGIGYADQLATEQMMRIMDRKNHRVVSRSDFVGQHERIFEAMTTRGSKSLDSEEWLAAHFPR